MIKKWKEKKKIADDTKNNSTRCVVQYNYFATVGGTQAYIYEYQSGNNNTGELDNYSNNGKNKELDRTQFNLRQLYTSSHPKEDFYSVTFAHRRSRQIDSNKDKDDKKKKNDDGDGDGVEKITTSERVICVGGDTKEILIIDIKSGKLHAKLTGNIGPILDLKAISCESNTCTCSSSSSSSSSSANNNKSMKHNLLCSAARNVIRLWNLDTLACIAIFADSSLGDYHNHFELTSVAWHSTGSKIVTAGGHRSHVNDPENDAEGNMFQIYIWNVLDSERLQEAIQASSSGDNDRSKFNSRIERFPVSRHNDVHTDKIDCVEWVGDLILSKSIHDDIRLWMPIYDGTSTIVNNRNINESTIVNIQNFQYPGNDFYFVRFATSFVNSSSILAVGNSTGQVNVWNMHDMFLQPTTLDNNNNNTNHQQQYHVVLPTVSPSSNNNKSSKKKKIDGIGLNLAFSPDGTTLVGCDVNGRVYRWEKQTKNEKKVE